MVGSGGGRGAGPDVGRAGAARGGRARAPSCVRVPLGRRGRRATATSRELAEDEHGLARTLVAALAPFGRPAWWCAATARSTGAPARCPPSWPTSWARPRRSAWWPSTPGPGRATAALLVERRLDGGWRERLRVPLPAVCSVEAAGVRLRRASLAGALDAADQPSPRSTGRSRRWPRGRASGTGPRRAPGPFRPRTRVLPGPRDADPRLRLLALTGALVAHDPPTVVRPVERAEAADVLLAFLVRHGYLEGRADRTPAGSTRGRRSREPAGRLDLAGGRRGSPGPGRCSSSRWVPPSSTDPTCRSPPTPTSPWPSSTAAAERDPLLVVGPGGGLRIDAASTRASPAPCPSAGRPPSCSWSSSDGRPPTIFAHVDRWSPPTAATPSRSAGRSPGWPPRVDRSPPGGPRWDGRPPRRPDRDLADAGHRPRPGAPRRGRAR